MNPQSTARRPVALVTGGSQGIGAAIALQLAHDGFDVAITTLQDDGASDGASVAQIQACGARALRVRGDLADVHDHARVLDAVCAWGGVPSCLVNNAGMGSPRRGDLLDIRAEDFDRVMATNLRGSFFSRRPWRSACWLCLRALRGPSSPCPRSAARWRRWSAASIACPRPAWAC